MAKSKGSFTDFTDEWRPSTESPEAEQKDLRIKAKGEVIHISCASRGAMGASPSLQTRKAPTLTGSRFMRFLSCFKRRDFRPYEPTN